MRAIAILVVLLSTVYAVLVLIAKPAPESRYFPQPVGRPLVIAHQGGEGLRPSNTMAAFEHAMSLGVDVLEMDIHSSADGVLVVIHDATVDRTTDGTGRVQDLTLAQLQALDAGHYWSADGGQSYPFRGQGITIPALEEIFQAWPAMWMNIEIKQTTPSLAAPLCDLLRRYELADQVLIASFHQVALDEFRTACPEVATSATEREVRAFFYRYLALLGRTYSPPAGLFAIQAPEYSSGFHVLSSRFIRAAHHQGLDVHAWTINETDEMARLIQAGVDGIITDYPDRLLQLLEE